MLTSFLETYFQDAELKLIFKDVLGTEQPEHVQALLDQALKTQLRVAFDRVLFIQSSIGVVFGLQLGQGEKVVLKVFSPKLPLPYLNKMNQVLTILTQENYPSPRVLSPIFPFGGTLAGFYEFIEGKMEDAHQAPIREELARYLAQFSTLVEQHQLPPLENCFQQAAQGRLWPLSHNALFDLKKASRGAGWLVQKARAARKILGTDRAAKKLAHTDWGVKNALFMQQRLVGIFDWDSLGSMSEAEMVGRAAAQFTADWDKGFKVTPSPEEARQFVEAYQKYRGKKFSAEEHKIMAASATYLITILARFEHCGGKTSEKPYQDLLKRCGENSFL